MTKYEVTVTIEASTIQGAINALLYPDGDPISGVSRVWAEETA